MLYSAHQMLAAFTRVEELALEKDESKLLADAVAEVALHYPMTIDPKVLAWSNLAMCAGMVYGPRVFLYNTRKSKERQKERPTNHALSAADWPQTGAA